MNTVNELRLLPAGPVGLANPGRLAAKAGAGTPGPAAMAPAPNRAEVSTPADLEQTERAAAQPRASEPGRAQSAEQRLKRNRLEDGPSPTGEGVAEIELSFGDLLDLINPLHHIPIVGTVYRAITGDEIGGPAKILGGMLFGGPVGFMASIVDTIVAQATGRDLGETVMAVFVDPGEAPAVQVVEARDLESISAQDNAPANGPPAAESAVGPVSDGADPFGLARGAAAPIAVTPGALTPVAAAEAPERSVARDAWPPTQNARPLVAAAAGPRAVETPGIGLGERPFAAAAQGTGGANMSKTAGASDLPAAAGNPIVDVEVMSTGAHGPGNQPLVPNLATAERAFAERMLEALDKYQAQASERYRNDRSTPRRLDLDL
jgi:hypothetical protein